MRRPKIAVTLGDPRGIGPEVAVRALRGPPAPEADFVLIGPAGLEETRGLELISIGHWSAADGAEEAGHLSAKAIETAVSLAGGGEVDAIVTAPISKSALAAAGYAWPGHTEMLRDLTGVPETALCLAAEKTALGSPLRVVLVTGHMALRLVPDAYTAERLSLMARLTHDDLRRWWGLERPRLAVCSLNPHASDDGLFGDEEERVCEPAITGLRREGIDVDGPFPADTVFLRAMRGAADAVLAPYHDVGMAVIKTAAFGSAVNVTLGLPFPRTSPDHGTAFDIAGRGSADPSSMRAALEAAIRFARRALTSPEKSSRLADV
ncbi:MAG: 4-hydroxythreonine-4-phosphate dehydrogenase PdxA [Gemmatimonadetes bacterium]|nr:4-hydroxythreonine-4-phosphate dehydrogenase PdxA [Gemmatimonadota bacterium]NIO32603.1 4-hydroxythreonine-4-phosphate dehydrogenase PdxA [Gemmatimonadota bacterium]